MAKRLSWATRLERAEKRGRFNAYEMDLAFRSWHTCAIGEKHGWHVDWENISDIPPLELSLGTQFSQAVQRQDIAEAKRIYSEIVALP